MLALGFVCCGLLAFYVYTSHKTIDITEFYHPYVQVNKEAALYQLNKDEYEEFAKVYPNVTMQLEDEDKQDMHTAYFKLKNQDVYVKAEDGKQNVAKYVEEVAKANGAKIAIKGFVRFETGEGIEKKEENFAEEVAKQMGN